MLLATLLSSSIPSSAQSAVSSKSRGVFYPSELIEIARSNIARDPWAANVQKQIVEAAQPWLEMSDEQLWHLMFGNTIKRSWMVWSNGYCPACKKNVPMYNWVMDSMDHPWKTRCPHCKELFPKNDFHKFYQSGLDDHNIFDSKRADRSLLFNEGHPDPKDPLHGFGVDDGEGYSDGNHRWRFIGAYLIYGQWKQSVLAGIQKLSAAYTITGERKYAHKAGILLDRVADLYPTFDFGKEGVMYEGPPNAGYISTWHDACEETRELALAYDQVFEGLKGDDELVVFLSQKTKQYHLSSPKTSVEDVQHNIEERILRDAIRNRGKIYSNYPRTEICVAILKTVLEWPHNRSEVFALLDPMIDKATAVDGVTGEKGLSGYSCFTIQGMAMLLALYSRLEPNFLKDCLDRHPALRKTYRFFIDTWCQQQYYPQSGDTGAFGRKCENYVGVPFSKDHNAGSGAFNFALAPSSFSFLWNLYELAGDPAYVQVLYHANGESVKGLPYDIFVSNPQDFQTKVKQVIQKVGAKLLTGSVDKQQWHLSILRSGKDKDARDLWLDYDSGGGHSHADGMNLGLFAKGLDLLPDFGYPPVHYGGWGSAKAVWYTMTAAHNTVVVDGQNIRAAAGKTTLWADGKQLRALRATGPELIGGKQFERTVVMVDVSPRDFYLVDVFRVVGGSDHAKFTHSHFGQITTRGVSLKPAQDFGHNTQMRNFQCDPKPQPGWSADWKIDDRFKYLPDGSEVHLRYTDLTNDAQAWTCEAWVSAGGLSGNDEAWIPRVMTRRQAKEAPLTSTFVSCMEPYEKSASISRIRRLPLTTEDDQPFPDSYVGVEVQLVDGRRDLIIAAEVENPLNLTPSRADHPMAIQKEWGLRFDGELCFVRLSSAGKVDRVVLCRGKSLTIGDVTVRLQKASPLCELSFKGTRALLEVGKPEEVEALLIKGRRSL